MGGHRQRRAWALHRRWWEALGEADMSQRELARRLGISQHVLSDVTGGTRKLSLNIAVAAEEALGQRGLAMELLTLQLEEDVTHARTQLLERQRTKAS